mmetsp:Transcript_2907/g.4114  ORF Transcript_2907/g.4114 Transcript_2907/m.4114 type:complete len:363 (+) Transcript_2907:184-1272(+)
MEMDESLVSPLRLTNSKHLLRNATAGSSGTASGSASGTSAGSGSNTTATAPSPLASTLASGSEHVSASQGQGLSNSSNSNSPARSKRSPRREKNKTLSGSGSSKVSSSSLGPDASSSGYTSPGGTHADDTQPSPPHTPKGNSSNHMDYVMNSPPSSPMIDHGNLSDRSSSSPGRSGTFSKKHQHIHTNNLSLASGPAPLSPSKKAFRRNESNHSRLSATSPGSGSTTSAQSTYLRTLTSTAAERKRTVAACRALRAQITRFEDAFIKVHGRPPKSAMDRAPLATTYAQYREWKRAIRADAASRIQAMMRGARVRMILVHDLKFADIVQRRMGRVEAEVMPPTYLNYPPSRGHGQHGHGGRGL